MVRLESGDQPPKELDLPSVDAMPPYDGQVAALNKQIGAVIPRQTMKDCSGASVMDDKTQVTSVHGISVLDLAREPLEANFALPLVHEIADANDRALPDEAVAAEVNLVGDPVLVAADAAPSLEMLRTASWQLRRASSDPKGSSVRSPAPTR